MKPMRQLPRTFTSALLMAILACSMSGASTPTPAATGTAAGFAEPPDPAGSAPPREASPTSPPPSENPNAIPINADLNAPLIPINAHILGQYLNVPQTHFLIPGTTYYNAARISTHFRGVYTGLYAEYYDWQDPLGLNDPLRPPPDEPEITNQLGTLDFLRLTVTNDGPLMLNVNMRGVREIFTHPQVLNNAYVNTDVNMLATLAADWVHYVNYTLQHFDTSNPPNPASPNYLEAHSAVILNDIFWMNRDGTSVRPKLPNPGETLPAVTYWEIGNEPNYPLDNFTLSPAAFAARYVTITNAMFARDGLINGTRTIKVGPSFIANFPPSQNSVVDYLNALKAVGAVVDFVSYHPYDGLYGGWWVDAQGVYHTALPDNADDYSAADLASIRNKISETYNFQLAKYITAVQATAPGTEIWFTEWNPSSWESSFHQEWKAKSMANALASLETVFTFARMGVDGAHFFSNPAFLDNDQQQPLFQTFMFLENNLGDELLAVYDAGSSSITQHRAYVTHQSSPSSAFPGTVTLWGLNWGTATQNFDFTVTNLDVPYEVGQLCLLAAPSLLHGAFNEVGMPTNPPLSSKVTVKCEYNPTGLPSGFTWTGFLTMAFDVPPNSWAAFTFWPTDAGVVMDPLKSTQIELPGTIVTHTVTVTNTSTVSDTMQLLYKNNIWAIDGPTVLPPLQPGESTVVYVQVLIPGFAPDGAKDTLKLTVFSNGGAATVTLETICRFPRAFIPFVFNLGPQQTASEPRASPK
jgi:hypothetical protein